ncbi:hypothetical protein Tco_1519744, partial [Tanacetum coccineum]
MLFSSLGVLQDIIKDSEEKILDFNKEDVFVSRDDMDTNDPKETGESSPVSDHHTKSSSSSFADIDDEKHVTQRIFAKNLQWIIEWLFTKVIDDGWDKHKENDAAYVVFQANVIEFLKQTYISKEKTDTTINNMMNFIESLKKKEDHEVKNKLKTLDETNSSISTNLISLTELLRKVNVPAMKTLLEAIKSNVIYQHEHYKSLEDSYNKLTSQYTTLESSYKSLSLDLGPQPKIKAMVSEMFRVFKALAPSPSINIPKLTGAPIKSQ